MHTVEVPTDDFFFAKLADAATDKAIAWCKTGNSQGAMQDTEKEEMEMMKLIPVPLFSVLDGFEQDLHAADVAGRLKFINYMDAKDYLKHTLSFCKACATTYGATAKERVPTIAAGAFATIPSGADKLGP